MVKNIVQDVVWEVRYMVASFGSIYVNYEMYLSIFNKWDENVTWYLLSTKKCVIFIYSSNNFAWDYGGKN
jgi:hypothetical protein